MGWRSLQGEAFLFLFITRDSIKQLKIEPFTLRDSFQPSASDVGRRETTTDCYKPAVSCSWLLNFNSARFVLVLIIL